MRKHRVLLQSIVGSLTACGVATMATAAGSDILVTAAKIEAGKLVITGTTAAAQMRLRLDGRTDAAFNTTSGADKSFSFSLVYLPKDCIVSLQRMQGASKVGAASDLVIANCAPSAITPRGTWNSKTAYEGLDLVSHEGSSWLAIRDNVNQQPGKSTGWQLFAAKGEALASAGNGSVLGAAGTVGPTGGVSPAIPSGPAGGDLTGTYPNPQIAAEAVTTAKIAPRAVSTAKLKDAAVTEKKIADGAVTSTKIAPNSITADHIQTDAVQASEIQDNSIDSGEIVDFTLTNQDVGVLWAEVNADGTLANQCSGCGITSLKIPASTGNYEVDFARNIATTCTAVATIGPAGGGSAAGQINVADRGGNAEAIFVDTNNAAGAAADLPFRLVVVC